MFLFFSIVIKQPSQRGTWTNFRWNCWACLDSAEQQQQIGLKAAAAIFKEARLQPCATSANVELIGFNVCQLPCKAKTQPVQAAKGAQSAESRAESVSRAVF